MHRCAARRNSTGSQDEQRKGEELNCEELNCVDKAVKRKAEERQGVEEQWHSIEQLGNGNEVRRIDTQVRREE